MTETQNNQLPGPSGSVVSKIGGLTERIKDIAAEKNRLTSELSELSLHKARTDMELGKLKKQFAELSEKKDFLENELVVSRKLVDSLRPDRDSLSVKLQETESELATLKAEHLFETSRSSEVQSELDSARKDLESFSPALRAKLQSDLQMAQDRISKLEKDTQAHIAKLSTRETALEEKTLELQKLRRHMSEVLA